MIARVVFFFSLFFLSGFQSWGQPLVKTPDEFLQYPYGSRFTPHHLLVSYFQYVDEVSDHVMLVEYGRTYELRPLIAAIISSPENLNRLEEIRLNNLRRSKMVDGEVTAENIAIVYLSYSFHGDQHARAASNSNKKPDVLLIPFASARPSPCLGLNNNGWYVHPAMARHVPVPDHRD